MKKLAIATMLAGGAAISLAHAQDAEPDAMASATLEGEGVEGAVTLQETASGFLHIEVEATGVSPGEHGFHVHETGECDAEGGFESAGGHIAGAMEHGVMSENGPHPGDLPNIHVGEDGMLHAEFFTNRMTITTEGDAMLMDDDGSAFVLHSGADDYMTDPSGESGDRVACGVLEAAT